MPVLSISSKIPYKDRNRLMQNLIRQTEKGFLCHCLVTRRCFSSLSGVISRRCHVSYPNTHILTKFSSREGRTSGVSQADRACFCKHGHASESGTNEKQLRSLDSYFGKLQRDTKLLSFDSSDMATEVVQKSDQLELKERLESLNAYLSKINDTVMEDCSIPSASVEQNKNDSTSLKTLSISKDSERAYQGKQKFLVHLEDSDKKTFGDAWQNDDASSLYLIGILASINIAVFLFEIASPIRNSDLELFSLPLLYGAKINHLIVVGEWWRLLTPMFLHAGIFHISLSCWALLTFGLQVCRCYGSFTFFMIYILGGVSGNLTSFLHTPEPTVGGTGPIFALIGAWLMYQIQNKDVLANEASESMFQKALIVTALGFTISIFGPIDDWTHFGSAFTGMAYGFFTCPQLQLDDASSGTRKKGLALVKRYADPCKSLLMFTIFVLVLSTLLFFIEPPLNALAYDSFIYI